MIRYHISLLILIFIASIAQLFMPAMPQMFNAQIHILLLTFLCAAVTVSLPPMLILAFICGFIWDIQNTIYIPAYSIGEQQLKVENLTFGYSMLLFALVGTLMQGIQPLFKKGIWQISSALVGLATFFYLTTDYLIISTIRGDFTLPKNLIYQISIVSLINVAFSLFIFLILFKLAELSQYTIKYDGLKRRYFKFKSLDSQPL